MKFVSDPPIRTKISKMKQRVRWQDPLLAERNIDQTRFVLEDGKDDRESFSFLVIGDTGVGPEHRQNAQRRIAELMQPHVENCRFLLHTGDVVYLVGSSEYYFTNFIKPYREFLVGGEDPEQIAYNHMTFKFPFLPVPGNHDYYDIPLLQGLLAGITLPVRQLLQLKLDFDMGWHGSYQGKAYAEAFLDFLCRFKGREGLVQHLDRYYTAKTETGRCLNYVPGEFTRLPNRYYTFRYGGIDFFALDSSTFNAPQPLPLDSKGIADRKRLQEQKQHLEQQKRDILEQANQLSHDAPEESEQLSDLRAKLQQISEMVIDIDKQLSAPTGEPQIDVEQLVWLRDRLIQSWQDSEVRGRVVFFHHPPYVTEATKWYQAQTITIRTHIRQVLNSVNAAIGDRDSQQPIVDLVLSGHAHCMEYLKTFDTGHADSNMHWIVCGGSGYSLRRQREEGADLFEEDEQGKARVVARSELFIGRNGHGNQRRRPYSFLKIDVQDGTPPRFKVSPHVVERYQRSWNQYEVSSFLI